MSHTKFKDGDTVWIVNDNLKIIKNKIHDDAFMNYPYIWLDTPIINNNIFFAHESTIFQTAQLAYKNANKIRNDRIIELQNWIFFEE